MYSAETRRGYEKLYQAALEKLAAKYGIDLERR